MKRLALVLSLLIAFSTVVADERDPVPASVRISPREDASFRKGLERRIAIDFEGKPLNEAIAHIAKVGELPILIDEIALEEEGIPLDEPVTLRTRNARIAAILPRILKPLGLTWMPRRDVLLITSISIVEERGSFRVHLYDPRRIAAAAARAPATFPVLRNDRVYPLAGEPSRVETGFGTWPPVTGGGQFSVLDDEGHAFPLVPHPPIDGRASRRFEPNWDDPEALVENLVVTLCGPPESWEDEGGPGSITRIGDLLAIRQTFRVHDEIERLLNALTNFAESPPGQPTLRPFENPTADEVRIRKALDAKFSVEFDRKPLDEALADMADRLKIEIEIDTIAFEEEGIPRNEPVTLKLENVSLRTVLERLLEPLGLTWFVEDDVLKISSIVVSEELGNLTIAFVDARDVAEAMGDPQEVTDAIVRLTGSPESWEEQGGPGTLRSILGGVIVVRQSDSVLREIEKLLLTLRKGIMGKPRKGLPRAEDVRTLDYTLTEHDPREVADLVETFVDPASWHGENGGAIRVAGRQLFVRTTLANHGLVHDLLLGLKPVRDPERPDPESAKSAPTEAMPSP